MRLSTLRGKTLVFSTSMYGWLIYSVSGWSYLAIKIQVTRHFKHSHHSYENQYLTLYDQIFRIEIEMIRDVLSIVQNSQTCHPVDGHRYIYLILGRRTFQLLVNEIVLIFLPGIHQDCRNLYLDSPAIMQQLCEGFVRLAAEMYPLLGCPHFTRKCVARYPTNRP